MTVHQKMLEAMLKDAKECNQRVKRRDGPSVWAKNGSSGHKLVAQRRVRDLEAYEKGETLKAIAARMGLAYQTAKTDLSIAKANRKSEGVPVVSVEDKKNESADDKIFRLKRAGKTIREICADLDLTQGRVSHRIQKMRDRGVDV